MASTKKPVKKTSKPAMSRKATEAAGSTGAGAQKVPDSDLLKRVRAALAAVPEVEEKKMFGGTAFLVRGKMCITARAERIMCRIDPAQHDAALEREGCQTVVMKGREYRGYVHVAAEAVKTGAALKYWIDKALAHNDAVASTGAKRR